MPDAKGIRGPARVGRKAAAIGLLFSILVMGAPANAQAANIPMTDEERGALEAYLTCYYQQIRGADDGIADPLTLARSVAPSCRNLLGAAADIVARSRQANRERIYAGWVAFEDEQGLRTVQAEREDRQKENPPAVAAPSSEPSPKHIKVEARPKPVTSVASSGKRMSQWRRAYIAKHGHQPPAQPK